MKRLWLVLLVMACPAAALTQISSGPGKTGGSPPPYRPAVPAPTTTVYGGGGWGGSSGASTAAGSALNGMSQVISSAGQNKLATSAAAVNMTEAQRNEIQNRQLATNTYFEMQATNKAAREAAQGPKPTMEQLARIAHAAVPKPVATSQFDPLTGKLAWPSALQEPGFTSQRSEVDQLFAQFATYGGLPYAEQTKVRQTIGTMAGDLKGQISEIPPTDYMLCRNFLNSLLYAVTKSQL